MTHSFRWLHLTDLHWGCAGHEHRWTSRKGTFKQSLKALFHETKLGLPLDVVFFTGDLVNMGKASEFQEVNHFLKDLWDFFREHQETPPYFIPIPGNHDLVRPMDETKMEEIANLVGHFSLAQDTGTKRKLRNAVFQKSETSNGWNLIKDAFANYAAWWEALPADIPKPDFKAGAIPGDFSWSFNKEGKSLGIVGLNSAFLQLDGENYEGMLALCLNQLQSACGDIEAWERSHALRMVLTHHPVSWLSSEWQEDFETETCPAGRFHVHLSGHTHTSELRSESKNGSKIRHNISAFSLFGAEKIKGKKGGSDIDRVYGYGAGKIELGNEVGKMYLWAKECKQIKGTGFHFVNPEGFGAEPEIDGAGPFYLEFPKSAATQPMILNEEKPNAAGKFQQVSKGGAKGIVEQRTFRQVLSDGIRSLLGKPHLNDFNDFAMADLGESIDLTHHLVQDLDLIDSLDFLTRTCRAFFENLSSGNLDKVLMDLEVLAGWLSLLSLKEEWEPKLCEDDQEFSGIDFYIPVRHFPSVEIVISKIRINPARFTFEATTSTTFRGENQIEYPDPSECGPECMDMVNHIKAVLWCKMSPKQEAMVFETLPDGRKRAKRFAPWMNERLIEKFFSTKSKEWRPTPYLLLNPSREGSLQISQDVLSQLRKDLAPLQIICLTQEEDIWKEGLNEEKVLEELESFFDVLQEAHDKLKG